MADIDARRLDEVLRRLAERMPPGQGMEILIVGGAAALLGGLLPAELTTFDCDVAIHPRQHWAALRRAAGEIAVTHQLSPSWFNTECQQSTVRRLPIDWRDRASTREFGDLIVHSIGRPDLIAMKLVAGRDKDIEHLQHLCPMAVDEVAFVTRYLDDLAERFPQEQAFVDDARLLLEDLRS